MASKIKKPKSSGIEVESVVVKLEFKDLSDSVITRIFQETTLLEQIALRRINKLSKNLIENNVWPKHKILMAEDLGDVEKDWAWIQLIQKMPNLKYFDQKLFIDYSHLSNSLTYIYRPCPEYIVSKLSDHCHHITNFKNAKSPKYEEYASLYLKNLHSKGVNIADRDFNLKINPTWNKHAQETPDCVKVAISGEYETIQHGLPWLDMSRIKLYSCKQNETFEKRIIAPVYVEYLELKADCEFEYAPTGSGISRLKLNFYLLSIPSLSQFDNLQRLTLVNPAIEEFPNILEGLIAYLDDHHSRLRYLSILNLECQSDCDAIIQNILTCQTIWKCLKITSKTNDCGLVFKNSCLRIKQSKSFSLIETINFQDKFHKLRNMTIEGDKYTLPQLDKWRQLVRSLAEKNRRKVIFLHLLTNHDMRPPSTHEIGDNWFIVLVHVPHFNQNEDQADYNLYICKTAKRSFPF